MSKPKLNLEQVYALLDKLENDDAFRALFQADAAAGLTQIGAPAEAAMCMGVKHLASKQTFRNARQALVAQLHGTLAYKPHQIDAAFEPASAKTLHPAFRPLATA